MSNLFEQARQRLNGSSAVVPDKLRDFCAASESGKMNEFVGMGDLAGNRNAEGGGDSSCDDEASSGLGSNSSSSDLSSNSSRDIIDSKVATHTRGGSDRAAADAGSASDSQADPAVNATN